MRLDPTPATDEESQLGIGVSLLARMGDAMDYAQLLWDDYVLGLNSERQKKNIYTPLAEQASSALGNVFQAEQFQGFLSATLAMLGWEPDGHTSEWFSWRAGLGAIVVCAAILLLYQALVPLARWLMVWWQSRATKNEHRPQRIVEFYARLETLLAKLEIRRGDAQTQREFAAAAGERLALLGPEINGAGELPRQIVEAFYRVRFGENTLTAEQSATIDRSLHQLTELVERETTPPAKSTATVRH